MVDDVGEEGGSEWDDERRSQAWISTLKDTGHCR